MKKQIQTRCTATNNTVNCVQRNKNGQKLDKGVRSIVRAAKSAFALLHGGLGGRLLSQHKHVLASVVFGEVGPTKVNDKLQNPTSEVTCNEIL